MACEGGARVCADVLVPASGDPPSGHDSTSTAISTLFLMLAQHGDVERKVLQKAHHFLQRPDSHYSG